MSGLTIIDEYRDLAGHFTQRRVGVVGRRSRENQIGYLPGNVSFLPCHPIEPPRGEPKNLFVANFIGESSMNLYPFEVNGNELVGNDIRYPLSDRLIEAVGDHCHVMLGIRPEDIEIVERDDSDSFAGTIQVVEPMGDQNFLHLTVGGQEITAAVPGEYEAEEGADVLLKFPEDSIHLFATNSGEALLNCKRRSTRLPTITSTEGETA
jgi:multiple sugar transport system ATP-binding protein